MKKSKSRTIESRGTPKSQKTIEQSPARNGGKGVPSRCISGKIISKNSPMKLLNSNIFSPKGAIKHYMSSVQLKPPALKTLKPSESQHCLKNIGKESAIQKPRIVKKKNQNLSELQTKLRTLQNQITSLKSNITSTDDQLQKIRKSRIKSKQSKKSSASASSKKRASQSIDKEPYKKTPSSSKLIYKSMVRPPSKGLNSYVTKWKPSETTNQNIGITQDSQNIKSKLSNSYYVKHTSPLMKEHLLQSLKIFNYMENIKMPSDHQINDIKVKLPNNIKNPKRKTVVFDLDETLIHCVEMGEDSDIKLPIVFPNGDVVQAGINIRKHAKQILINLCKKFEVIVFTASHSCYANVILDYIDPDRVLIHHRFFRQNCYKTEEGMFIKDLRIFGNRNLDNIVLVDNAPYSYYFQLSNGIPILPFYNSKSDIQLKTLQKFLINQIYPANNVRPVLQKYFKLNRYGQFATSDKIIKELYKD